MAGFQQRPRIKIKMTFAEHVLEIISISGLFTAVHILLKFWPELPATIPSHFNFYGEVDAWSDKNSLLFLLGMNVLLYLLMTIVRRFPHTFNFPVKVTKNNAEKQYQLAVRLIAILKAEVVWLFAHLQWQIIQVALGGSSSLGPEFLVIVLVGLTLPLIIYLKIARQNHDVSKNTARK